MKRKYKKIVLYFTFFVKYLFKDLFYKGSLLVNSWLPPKTIPGCYNFGDDINYILVELISGKKAIPFKFGLFSRIRNNENYLCIGSIISQLSNSNSIIWGAGAISDKLFLKQKPKAVCAVRGPLTRKYLRENGVPCPEIYGDPALLLPNYYKPPITIKKKYQIGIIPHYKDKYMELLKCYEGNSDIYIFDMQNYGSWKLFINTICSCSFILSSSLHGLIVSDAYNIPNCWVEFSDNVQGDGFKFRDYFLSVKKNIKTPFAFDKYYSVEELLLLKSDWRPPLINLDILMDVCPFLDKSLFKK